MTLEPEQERLLATRGTFMAIRRKCDGKFLCRYSSAGRRYREARSWTSNIRDAKLIRTQMGLSQILNRMRKDPYWNQVNRWETDPTPRNELLEQFTFRGMLNPNFTASEFAVEEVLLQTTDQEVPF